MNSTKYAQICRSREGLGWILFDKIPEVRTLIICFSVLFLSFLYKKYHRCQGFCQDDCQY